MDDGGQTAAGDPLALLGAALDALSADDLSRPFAPQLLERLRGLLIAGNRLNALVASTVRACETTQAAEVDGLKTMASWLRGHGRLAGSAATALVRAGRTLEHLPAVAAAAGSGWVPAGLVAELGRAVTGERLAQAAEQGVDLAEVDAAFAAVAASGGAADVADVVQRYLAQLDPDGPEPDPTEGRRLSVATHADGSVSGRFELDAIGGERVRTALEAVVQAARPAGDDRTRAQQNADALVQLCDNQLAAGQLPQLRGRKPQVVVRVDLDDLASPDDADPGSALLGSGVRLSALRARLLACDGQITRIVFGPDGVPIDHGRTQRLFTPPQRSTIEARDAGCVFAGCGAPTWWCDVHHLLHWADGGATDVDNAALLCERHHTKVHHGFRIARSPSGRWRTWRPDGSEILIGRPPDPGPPEPAEPARRDLVPA